MSGCGEYIPTPKFSPIFKVIRSESGAFSGSCDFNFKLQGILRQTQADISGVIDAKAKTSSTAVQGPFPADVEGTGVEGDNEDFSGSLQGVADDMNLGANIMFVNGSLNFKQTGTVHTVFTYLNNKAPSDWPKRYGRSRGGPNAH